MKGYELVFEKLKKAQPRDTDYSIIITKEKDGDEEYFEVSGLHKQPITEEDKYLQGIESIP